MFSPSLSMQEWRDIIIYIKQFDDDEDDDVRAVVPQNEVNFEMI